MGQGKYSAKKGGWKHLQEKERYQIEILCREKLKPAEIGKRLGRDRRTIEREIARGSVKQRDSEWRERIVYCADAGQRVAQECASNKGRPLKIGHDHKLAKHMEKMIKEAKYSPDAVIGGIKAQELAFEVSICTKTLYNYISRGLFAGISDADLPVKSKKQRNPRKKRTVALNNLKGRSLEERPEQIEQRAERGHWEMDCVVGSGKGCLLVLTERKYREEKIFKLRAKTQKNVIAVLDRLEREYENRFGDYFKSITMDNGSEFLDMKGIERSCLNADGRRTTCYYAHPYSAWERGSNEVANKLIRRFVPKGTNIDKLTKADVKRIEQWMNNYPRRMFGYKSANQMIAAYV